MTGIFGCGGDAGRACSEEQAIFRFSPAPPELPNELLRVLCAETPVQRDGCPIMRFGFSPEGSGDGFVEIGLASAEASCPAFFEGQMVESSLPLLLHGSRAEMTQTGILIAEGDYEISGEPRGRVQVTIGSASPP
ncbi:MAG: hypothetical protein WAU39_14895 [Polyangiales bacterium]